MTPTHPDGGPGSETPPRTDRAYAQAIDFLYDRINYERLVRGSSRYPFRLRRLTALLRRLGLEQYLHADSDKPPVPLVHVAGTKGKGSTSAMVAAVLSAAGLRTGQYTSPHLHHLEERFRVDGRPCDPDELVSLVDRIRDQIDSSEASVSFFDLTTAIALLHFETRQCDAVVLEVGLGGRLDSTNVCAPSVTAITTIGLDHQHVLGSTVEEIAAEKAGIIKPGVPVISGVEDRPAAEVISAKASDAGAKLWQLGRDFTFDTESTEGWGTGVSFAGDTPPLGRHYVSLRMEGAHQAHNAAVALAVVDQLRDAGVDIPPSAIASAMQSVQCAGRIERFDLPEGVTCVVDAAHNRDSVEALCRCLSRRFQNRRCCVVFGTSIDKDADVMLRLLSETADEIVLTRFTGNPRYVPPDQLLPLLAGIESINTRVTEDPIAACRDGLASVGPGGVLVVCGSFFLAAETRRWFQTRAVPSPTQS